MGESPRSKRSAKTRAPTAPPRGPAGPETARPGLAAAALGISGFASLTLQVVWTRLLALILGPDHLRLQHDGGGLRRRPGGGRGRRIAARRSRPGARCRPRGLPVHSRWDAAPPRRRLSIEGLLAIAGVIARPEVTFNGVLARQALLATALLAPMTIAFGAAFPFAVAVATRRDDTVTSDLGLIYAVNTAGAITRRARRRFRARSRRSACTAPFAPCTILGAAAAAALLVIGAGTVRSRVAGRSHRRARRRAGRRPAATGTGCCCRAAATNTPR